MMPSLVLWTSSAAVKITCTQPQAIEAYGFSVATLLPTSFSFVRTMPMSYSTCPKPSPDACCCISCHRFVNLSDVISVVWRAVGCSLRRIRSQLGHRSSFLTASHALLHNAVGDSAGSLDGIPGSTWDITEGARKGQGHISRPSGRWPGLPSEQGPNVLFSRRTQRVYDWSPSLQLMF